MVPGSARWTAPFSLLIGVVFLWLLPFFSCYNEGLTRIFIGLVKGYLKCGKADVLWLVVMTGCVALAFHGGLVAAQETAPPPNGPPSLPPGTKTGFEGGRSKATELLGNPQLTAAKIVTKGSNVVTRSAFQSAAEEVRKEFRSFLKVPKKDSALNEIVIPIEIHLSGNPTDVISGPDMRREVVVQANTQFKILLYCKLHESFKGANFDKEMLHVLLLHQLLRIHIPDSRTLPGAAVEVPEWLVRGFYQHLLYRRSSNQGQDAAGILEGGNAMGVHEILETENADSLDPITRGIFDVSAGMLVRALLEQPDGRPSFQQMLYTYTREFTTKGSDPTARLRQHFPGMRESVGALDKWWTLQLATMGELTAFDFYSVARTQQILDAATFVVIRDDGSPEEKKGVLNKFRSQEKEAPSVMTLSISEFSKFIDRDDLSTVLFENIRSVKSVHLRGFPLYHDLAERYEFLFQKMIAGHKNGIAAELKTLEKLRLDIDTTMERVNDVMNHFEATQAPAGEGEFDGYQKMRRRIERMPPPKRNDAISKHLDQLEKEFE